jgi:hypothetical protein
MSKFIINNNISENHQNQNAYYNRYQTFESTGILPINNSNIRYHNTLFDQNFNSVVHKCGNLTSNNDARSITLTWTPQSIREFTYNILTNTFDENYPTVNSYNLCDQKISIVFQAGNTHWTRFSDSSLSYPINHQFARVNESDHKLDCKIKPPKPRVGPPDECDLTFNFTYFVENSIRKVRVIVSSIPTVCLVLQIKFFDDMSTPLSDWINIQSINSLQSDIEIPFFSDEVSKAIVRLYSCEYIY